MREYTIYFENDTKQTVQGTSAEATVVTFKNDVDSKIGGYIDYRVCTKKGTTKGRKMQISIWDREHHVTIYICDLGTVLKA